MFSLRGAGNIPTRAIELFTVVIGKYNYWTVFTKFKNEM